MVKTKTAPGREAVFSWLSGGWWLALAFGPWALGYFTQRPARSRAGELTVFDHHLTIDDHVVHAGGILMGIKEGGTVAHGLGVK